MKVVETPIAGMVTIEPEVFGDHRGFFLETYNLRDFAENGIEEPFVQDNMSRSRKATLRGLHYQLAPHSQGKLVRVTYGEVFDVGVDLRSGSPTFGKWHGEVLSAENKKSLYVPPGFAHGFLVLTEEAEFHYKCTKLYRPESDRGILWNDPAIGIVWPIEPDPSFLSSKDVDAPLLRDAEMNF